MSIGPARSEISVAVRRLAEMPNAYLPLAAGDERIEGDEAIVSIGAGGAHPAFNVVQQIRFRRDDLAAQVEKVRAHFRARGRARATWEIDPEATPHDLRALLVAHGMKPYEEPIATGMVLRRPLPDVGSEVRARRAKSLDDTVAAFEVLSTVFGERSESVAERRARAEREMAARRRSLFVAEIDGEIVAAAHAIDTPDAVVLVGSATLPHARHRGAYRALVAARYEDAARRGTPTLVIQAGAMSRPILERLGFEVTAEIHVVLDDCAGSSR